MSVDEENRIAVAAREYREAGVAVCRIRPDEKRPKDRRWTTRSADPIEFGPNDGIGLVCGWPSSGGQEGRFLVCVDLDVPEAINKADQFLPPTGAIEGRPGKHRSHWWFYLTDVPSWAISKARQAAAAAIAAGKSPGPFKKAFNHIETGVRVIDFQGTGGQAVVPPSVHEGSGEQRRWEEGCSFEKIATVTFEELWRAVCLLAEACGVEVSDVNQSVSADESEDPAEPTETITTVTACVDAAVEPAGQAQGACTRACDVPMDERVRRCEPYLRVVDLAKSGNGGHGTTFRIARLIVNDFAVTDREQAMSLMRLYNQWLKDGGQEQWSERDLEHKLDEALAAPDDPKYPFGCKLIDRSQGDDPWGDPSRLADAFVQGRPVLFFSGRYFVYNGRHYDELDATTLKAQVWSFIEAEAKRRDPEHPPKVNRSIRDGVVAAIEARGVTRFNGRSCDVSFNAWLPGTGRGGDTLVVRNGLFDVVTGNLSPHTPNFLGLYCLPYDYDPAAVCPTWERAVDRVCGGDAELKKLIQQWFGYCLTTSTDQQKFMVLVGEGANGKSTLVGGLLAVLGGANASHVSLEKFSGTFDLGYSLGKLVNVPDDMSEIDKASEGVLKTYTSGGAMAFNQKNRPILFARPTAKLMFCTNIVPRFSDRSSGLWRRLLLVPLNVVIPEAERVKGMDKPAYWETAGETAGMLNWALTGLKSLAETNGFVEPACVRAAVGEHQLESNPTRVFLTEHLEASAVEAEPIPSRLLYAYYREWMEEHGHTAMAHTSFTKELRRAHTTAARDTRRVKRKEQDQTTSTQVEKVLLGVKWTSLHEAWMRANARGFSRILVPSVTAP